MTTTRTPRIHVEHHRHVDGRTFHTNAALGKPDKRDELINDLKSIDGVTQALPENRYAVQVRIGRAFGWDEVEPQVIALLAAYYGWSHEDVQVNRSLDDSDD